MFLTSYYPPQRTLTFSRVSPAHRPNEEQLDQAANLLAKRASEWWAQFLSPQAHSVHDNGLQADAMHIGHQLSALDRQDSVQDEWIELFRTTLAEKIKKALLDTNPRQSRDCGPFLVVLEKGYFPSGILRETINETKMPGHLPINTNMCIENGRITVEQGRMHGETLIYELPKELKEAVIQEARRIG